MNSDPPVLSVDLWRADAVVLHFWLTSVDLDALPFEHETVAAEADDEEIVRSHDLVERTGTVTVRRAAPEDDGVYDDYGLEPF